MTCAYCGKGFPIPSPALFSFQSPLGACTQCKGFGRLIELDWDKVIPDPSLSVDEGAIKPWNGSRTRDTVVYSPPRRCTCRLESASPHVGM